MRLTISAVLWSVAAISSVHASAKPDAVIPLVAYQGKFDTIHATIGGHEGTFLFDTGEGVTMISPKVASNAGCTPWANITGFRMTGERLDSPRCDGQEFRIEGAVFKAPSIGVFDIMALMGKGAPQLDGSVGLDIFAGKTITLDPVHHQIIVESAASLAERTAHATEVPVRLVRDAEGLAISVDMGVHTSSGTAWMELDTGNGGPTVFVSREVAPTLSLDPQKIFPDIKDPQPVAFDVAKDISFKGNARVMKGLIMDGNIGMQFLKDWNLTLDLAAGRAWLAPATP